MDVGRYGLLCCLHTHPAARILLQVVKEARRLNAFCVRGNHDDSALAAYHAKQRGEDVDVRFCCCRVVCAVVHLQRVFDDVVCLDCCSHHQSMQLLCEFALRRACAPARRGMVTVSASDMAGFCRFCSIVKCSAALLCSQLALRSRHLHLQAKNAWVTGLSADDAAWMAELPFTLSIPSRRIIVAHAGVLPGVPLAQQSLADLYTVGGFPART